MAEPGSTNPYQAPVEPGNARPIITLRGVLALVALSAALFGLGVAAPGLAILLAVVAIPLSLRMAVSAAQRRGQGAPLGFRGMLGLLIGSLSLVLVAEFAGSIAFMIVCFPVALVGMGVSASSSDWSGMGPVIAAFGLGGIAAIAVAALLARQLWKMPDQMADAYTGVVSAESVPEQEPPR